MINLYDLIQAANGQLFGEPHAQIFTDFTLDPDKVDASMLYVSLPLEHGDTESTLQRAIDNGVGGILCINPPNCDTTGVSVVMVADPVDALFAWSHFIIERMGVRVVAVVGSDNHAVTAKIITDLLAIQYEVHAADVDVDGRLSVPFSLASLSIEHDILILKLSVRHRGDMQRFLETLQPQTVVMLNLDCTHSAHFEACEQYLAEYASLAGALERDALLVVNFDDDLVMQTIAQSPATRLTVSIDRFGADMMAFNVVVGARRTGFDLRIASERHVARWMPLLGRQHLYSALAAIAVAQYYGIPLEDALRTLTVITPLPGRLNPLVGINEALVIDDSHSASPSSALVAVDLLAKMHVAYKRRFFILGDMDDLGAQSIQVHRHIGQEAARVADVLITQGVEASAAARAAIDAGMPVADIHATYSPQDAVAALLNYDINPGDIIIVKGGATAMMERVVLPLLQNPDDSARLVRQSTSSKAIRQPFRPLRPTWLEIYPDQIARNLQTIRANLPDDVVVMAVVKANGYGHGAVMTARTALQNGATYIAVANLAEAIELREAGVQAPILVQTYLPVEATRQAIQYDVTATIFDLEIARQYNRLARDMNATLKYHVKIDTGMGRLGILPRDAVYTFRHLSALKFLELEGVYTHLSVADEDPDYTQKQITTFRDTLRPITAAGFQFKYTHAANSPATLYRQGVHFNMVRVGLAMYGMNPASKEHLPDGIAPALAWKTTIAQVKTLPAGHPVGYGNTYRTRQDETIAILPVGYADGFRRAPRTWRHVLIKGHKAPIVGRISMEKTAVDVSRIPDVQIGEEVVLIGAQGDEQITVDDVANWLGTVNYEVVTTLNQNIPRILR